MKCHKAQAITTYAKTDTSEYTKCINLASSHFRKSVTDSECDTCPLKQLGPCSQGCNKRRRPGLKFSEPVLKDGYLVYKEENAPVPEGFEKTESGVKNLWPDCPGIVTNNTINDDGSLKVVVKCSFKKEDITFEACTRCFEDLRTQEEIRKKEEAANKEDETTPPPMPTQVKHYAQAIYNWVKEGREVRTDDEVDALLKICKECCKYDAKKHICKHCGCRISSGGRAISNKLKMKSERCPIGKW